VGAHGVDIEEDEDPAGLLSVHDVRRRSTTHLRFWTLLQATCLSRMKWCLSMSESVTRWFIWVASMDCIKCTPSETMSLRAVHDDILTRESQDGSPVSVWRGLAILTDTRSLYELDMKDPDPRKGRGRTCEETFLTEMT
jgi:hypothetical protein